MNDDLNPMAQAEAESEILRLSRVLTKVTEDVADASTESARAEHAYKVAYARAIYQATGTVVEKEASATIATEAELLRHKLADAVLKANQESGRNVRAQLDALRSVNSNIRASVAYPTGRGA